MNQGSNTGLSGFARVKAVILFAPVATGLVCTEETVFCWLISPNYVRVKQESSLRHTRHWLVSHYELR